MEWRNVPGYARYAISISTKEGMCVSLDYKGKGVKRLLSNNPKKSGRIYWSLSDENGKRVCKQAARWVAITFPELVQGEYFEGAEIDHIDGDKLNNHPSNLRWVNHKENMNNPVTVDTIRSNTLANNPFKGKHHTEEVRKRISLAHKGKLNNPKLSRIVQQFSKDGILIAEYPSVMEAMRKTGISDGNIPTSCRGKRAYAGGYVWRFKY